MTADRYDVAVIGAGIHGAGVAQAAAAAGHSVLVLEQDAVAAATSSRSSKLIHGGLRYLENARFGLVRESLRERELLLRLAPELVELVPFHIPVYEDTRRRPWQIALALLVYRLLGGLAPSTRFERLSRREWDRLDGLELEGLQAVFRYRDAQTDDAALTRAVLDCARTLGAQLACPARFLSAARGADGYLLHYSAAGEERACHARALVNAAGPWVDQVLAHVTPAVARRPIELVRGTHVLVEGTPRCGIYYVEAPGDRRAVFIMPWRNHTLVGTTESVFVGDPATAQPLPAEIEYLCRTLRHYFPTNPARVLDAFAGLRVLPKDGTRLFHRTREVRLAVDERRGPRLVTIYGGKLTTYRATAAKVLKRLKSSLPPASRQADTRQLRIR